MGDAKPNRTLLSPPLVSKSGLCMAGIAVDVYGLDELALPGPAPRKVSCIWLYHGRLGQKEDMADFAMRVVDAWNQRRHATAADRGLIAVAFDQRNHGTRHVSDVANRAWRDGNPNHAIDMFASIAGMVSDTRSLMDFIEGYIFQGEGDETKIDQHLVLGVSLGGHSAWQILFAEPRVQAGVVIIGCPDYMGELVLLRGRGPSSTAGVANWISDMMKDRARKSKRSSFKAEDSGATFVGSKDFPNGLVASVLRLDPKGILFGMDSVVKSPPEEDREALRRELDSRIRGKKFLVCSGADDKLVPYGSSAPFLDFLAEANRTFFAEGNVYLRNKVYAGAGHTFSPAMAEDAMSFLVRVVAGDEAGLKRDSVENRSMM
jgi:pimeloyl-ACP methyl ester carboxylesterase